MPTNVRKKHFACYANFLYYGVMTQPTLNPLRQKAEQLRDQGYSYNMIRTQLGIAKSTLSNWFKDKAFTPNEHVLQRIQYGPIRSATKRHNLRVQETERIRQEALKELGTVSKRDLFLLGIGLYIGEGAKSHEFVRFTNSDPDVIRTAMRWFREVCDLGQQNFRIELHLYPDSNVSECLNYWSHVTHLPIARFAKVQIDWRENKSRLRKKKLPYGTAHITIAANGDPSKGVRLHRRIMGWIMGVSQAGIV